VSIETPPETTTSVSIAPGPIVPPAAVEPLPLRTVTAVFDQRSVREQDLKAAVEDSEMAKADLAKAETDAQEAKEVAVKAEVAAQSAKDAATRAIVNVEKARQEAASAQRLAKLAKEEAIRKSINEDRCRGAVGLKKGRKLNKDDSVLEENETEGASEDMSTMIDSPGRDIKPSVAKKQTG
jgi:multidrug efflux pump subunit AcrA (membrane-fusion protein)